MEFTVSQIANILNGKVEGDSTLLISSAAKIEEGRPGCISFLSNLKYEHFLYTTLSTAVIVDENFKPRQEVKAALIYVPNAYLAFTRLLEEYQKALAFAKTGVEEPSFIGTNTTIGSSHYRGAFSYIGSHCTIGNHVHIYPGAYIGDHVTIGDHTVIHPGAKIYARSIIGNNCSIFANAVIGSDGFGFAPQADGTYKTIPQLGNVVIEDNVSIGSNTTIDCATLGSTIIRSGVKLDNLIQVAHNVEIGKNTVIAAQSGISGSSKLGENCVIAGQVGIAGHLSIANKTMIGAQSGLGKSIAKEGLSYNGSPATDLNSNLRSLASLRRLPELEKRILELEKSDTTKSKQ